MITKLKEHLIEFEGISRSPYYDTADPPRLTIGVGRNLTDNGLTTDEVMFLLDNDVQYVLEELQRHFPWYKDLPETAQLVLADMSFNMGLPTLLSFKKMLEALEAHEFKKASSEILSSKYAKQVGRRAIYNSHLLENLEN